MYRNAVAQCLFFSCSKIFSNSTSGWLTLFWTYFCRLKQTKSSSNPDQQIHKSWSFPTSIFCQRWEGQSIFKNCLSKILVSNQILIGYKQHFWKKCNMPYRLKYQGCDVTKKLDSFFMHWYMWHWCSVMTQCRKNKSSQQNDWSNWCMNSIPMGW